MNQQKDRSTELNGELVPHEERDTPEMESPLPAAEPASQETTSGQVQPQVPAALKPEPEAAVMPLPEEAREPAERPVAPLTTVNSPERARVHIAPNLLDVATGRAETTAEKKEAKENQDLNEAVHSMLMIGLAISTALMLIGLVEDLALQRTMPTVEPDLGQVIEAVLAFRPSGFFGLGLIVLIATPILRVLGSIIAFALERDWRYAGITFVVLMIVVTSIMMGKG